MNPPDPLICPVCTKLVPSPEDLVGTVRRFGQFGPEYVIEKVLRPLDNGDYLLKISVAETGEEDEREYSFVLRDPGED